MTHYTITRKGMKGFISPKPQGLLLATLNKHCSFELPGKQFMPNPEWAVKRLYRFENASFPWGLLERVLKIFEANQKANGDTFDRPLGGFVPNNTAMILNHPQLRSYQKEAILKLIQNIGGVLSMPTGAGKTLTTLAFLRAVELDAVVIVHTLDLKRQWIEEAEKFGVKLNVVTYQSPLAAEFIKISKVVVFDECHHVAAKTVYVLAGKCREDQIRIGLSATPWREDGCDLLIEAALGPIVYRVDRKDLIRDGYLVNAKVHYFSPVFERTSYLSYQEEYETHIVKNDDRNSLIILCANKLILEGRRVLILVNQIEHGQTLERKAIELGIDTVFIHGQVKDRSIGDAKLIIASQVFNEGVDFPELDALIMAGGGKSSIRVTQQVGRVLRQRAGKGDAVVVDFVDTPKHLAKHYKARRTLLEEEFEVTEGWE